MQDRYTKAVLTVIAGALVILAVQQATPPAGAFNGCGDSSSPCHVVIKADALLDKWGGLCGYRSSEPCYVELNR